jgi:hypothetical protein
VRSVTLALILAAANAPLTAQQPPASQPANRSVADSSAASRQVEKPVTASDTAPIKLSAAATDSINELIDQFRKDPQAVSLPAVGEIGMGGRTIAAGTTVTGPVAAAGGPLHVFGTINGDAVAIGSDIIVHAGGRVAGNAVAALGTITLDGGTIVGEMRQLGGVIGRVPTIAAVVAQESPIAVTKHALALSSSWLLILLLIGIGVYLFAKEYLDGVVESLEGRFGRSFWAGVAAQLSLAPVLGLLCVALAVTVIGILLIPFAIVAFVLAVAGLITLGFLAVARITGESFAPAAARARPERVVALRGIFVGILIYMGLWVVTSAFAWAPRVEMVLRGIAVAITWVAATAGLGAAVISRGGTRRHAAPAPELAAVNDLPWQTPTPVTGVVAARRPTPSSTATKR